MQDSALTLLITSIAAAAAAVFAALKKYREILEIRRLHLVIQQLRDEKAVRDQEHQSETPELQLPTELMRIIESQADRVQLQLSGQSWFAPLIIGSIVLLSTATAWNNFSVNNANGRLLTEYELKKQDMTAQYSVQEQAKALLYSHVELGAELSAAEPVSLPISLTTDELNAAGEWVIHVQSGPHDQMKQFMANLSEQVKSSGFDGVSARDWTQPLLIRDPSDLQKWIVAIDPSSGRSEKSRVRQHLHEMTSFARSQSNGLSELVREATVLDYPRSGTLLKDWQ